MAEGKMKLTRVVLLGMACAVLGFGQAKQEQKPAQEQKAKPEARGKTEGIKVHGHWVLEIRNPDGSVASRKEFENSLATGTGNGAVLIAQLLAGGVTAGPWAVIIGVVTGGASYSLFAAQTAALCSYLSSSPPVYPCSSSLTISGTGAGQLIFQGSTPATTAAGGVAGVGTEVFTCANNTGPQSCLAQSGGFLGGPALTPAQGGMTIQVGQNITVTVTISFS
jgi:hypothetical protein